jgi:predicted nucleic acid-binding protein
VTKYVVDSMAYLRYLVDRLPDEANTIFDRAEAGLDVLYAPDVVIGETLYEVTFGGHIAGVQLQGNPNDVYRRTVTNGPLTVASLDEHAMAIYASLAEFYEAELHDGLIHAAHRTLDTEAVISDDTHLRQNDVELVWD